MRRNSAAVVIDSCAVIRRRLSGVLLAVLVALGASCSGGASSGAALAQSVGCAACHGDQGQGGIAPAWKGLYGSHVTLSTGSVVVADEAYLRRSILHPQAQLVKGYTVRMPTIDLSTAQLNQLVGYIESLRSSS